MISGTIVLLLTAATFVSSTVVPVASSCAASGSCTTEIQAAIDRCAGSVSSAPCTVMLDYSAVYPLPGSDGSGSILSINIPPGSSMHPFTFDGRSSTLMLQGLTGLFSAYGGTGVIFKDFEVDMARLPYTLARATAANSSGTFLTVEDPARYPAPAGATSLGATPWVNFVQSVLQYDMMRYRPAAAGVDDYFLPPAQKTLAWLPGRSEHGSPAPVQVFLEDVKNMPTGDDAWYILRHQVYGLNGITGSAVQGFQVSNVTLWTVPGMGIVCEACTGVEIDGLQIKKKCDSAVSSGGACVLRPMSITADGTHLTSCRGGDVHISNTVYEGQGDDGINIPSRYWEMRVISPDRKSAQVWQRGAMNPFVGEVGDSLLFYNRSTFKAYGMGPGAVALASPGPHPVHGWINFSAPLPVPAGMGTGVWDLVLNLNNQPRSITLRNNRFERNRARGAILKASNVAVQGCVFNQTSGPAIQVMPDAGVHWFEADVVSRGNWTLEDSQVLGCSYGAASNGADVYFAAYVPAWEGGRPSSTKGIVPIVGTQHRNVTVRGVTFVPDNGQAGVRAIGVAGLTIDSCRVDRVGGSPPGPGDFGVSKSCTDVSMQGNVCEGGGSCRTYDPTA